MVFKKKQQQGMTKIVEPPKMPISALTNPVLSAAEKAGFNPDLSPKIINVTPQSLPDLSMKPINEEYIYKGVDISKGFARSDFASNKEYEQAKNRAVAWGTSPEGIAQKRTLDIAKEGEVNTILQQQRMASLDPALLQQAGQLGTVEPYTPEMTNVDIGQAVGAGLRGVLPTAIGGAAGGAALGLAGSAGTLSLPAAAIGGFGGAVAGFVRAYIGDLKRQRGEDVAAIYTNLPQTTKNLRMLITDTNSGGDAAGNMEAFQAQLSAMDKAYSDLKLISQKKPLGEDATVQMEKFENFYATGGSRQYLINEMQQAIYNPNPAKQLVTLDDFTDLELE